MNLENIQPTGQEAIIAEVKEKILSAYSGADKMERYDRLSEFGQYLLKKYPDCKEHALFHVLVGSTPYKVFSLFDFPGDDSIEKFVKERL